MDLNAEEKVFDYAREIMARIMVDKMKPQRGSGSGFRIERGKAVRLTPREETETFVCDSWPFETW